MLTREPFGTSAALPLVGATVDEWAPSGALRRHCCGRRRVTVWDCGRERFMALIVICVSVSYVVLPCWH